jgi:hypothetical protein
VTNSAGVEDAVHGDGALVDDGPQLLAVNGLGDGRAARVADKAGDVLDGYALVGQQGHEAVA